jgi:hypothetical protein
MAAPGTINRLEPPRATPHKWLIALAVMLGITLEVLDSSTSDEPRSYRCRRFRDRPARSDE